MAEQQNMEKYCKVCNQERIFVTSLSPSGNLICTQCGYRQSLSPFKLIIDQFGFKIILGDEK